MWPVRPSSLRLRQGAFLLGLAILLLLVLDGEWVRYVALGLGLAGSLCVLMAVGRPRHGERPPFPD